MLNITQNILDLLGGGIATENHVYGSIALLIIALLCLIVLLQLFSIYKLSKKIEREEKKTDFEKDGDFVDEVKPHTQDVGLKEISWSKRLQKGLSRSRSEVWDKLGGIFKGRVFDDELREEMEEILYSADLGPDTVMELMEYLEKEVKLLDKNDVNIENIKKLIFTFLKDLFVLSQQQIDTDLYIFDPKKKGMTKTIMVVGVNGAGKTTTIGKLATRLTRQGANVVVGACDTFRAAAVDQLKVWCDRASARIIMAKEGTNPSGVAYEALDQAIKSKADYCILDTAGRLHTKGNLMDELRKNKKVLQKLDSAAPHQILLVLDAITGQNAIRQAEEFHNTLNISSLVFTKCDGSSKAGSAISIVRKLKLPISYIGVGESVEDLDKFDKNEYLNALLGL